MQAGRRSREGAGRERTEDLVVGRQAVLEVLRRGSPLKVVIAPGQKGKIVQEITAQARRKNVPLEILPCRAFDAFICRASGHQGVAALVKPFPYRTLAELSALAGAAGEPPFLLFLDHLQDPHNLGAVLRTAHAAGVHGVVIPGRRAAPVTFTVRKVAAGAAETLPVARVVNLSRSLEELKKQGYWIYGADADGAIPYYRTDFNRPLVLVLGSEGKGLSPVVRTCCDQILSIPMRRNAGSLNVSVAAGVLIYAAAAQRGGWFSLP